MFLRDLIIPVIQCTYLNLQSFELSDRKLPSNLFSRPRDPVSSLRPTTCNRKVNSYSLYFKFRSSSPAASDSSASSSNNVTVALTGVFGALLFIVILCFFLHHLLKGYRRRQYEREREFRRGTQPYGKSKSNIAPATEKPYGGGGVFRGLLGGSGSPPSSGGGSVSGAPSGERSGTPLSNASVGILRPPRASGNSPLGTAGAYATTKGGPMRQSPPVDPRQSIDFLSVRS